MSDQQTDRQEAIERLTKTISATRRYGQPGAAPDKWARPVHDSDLAAQIIDAFGPLDQLAEAQAENERLRDELGKSLTRAIPADDQEVVKLRIDNEGLTGAVKMLRADLEAARTEIARQKKLVEIEASKITGHGEWYKRVWEDGFESGETNNGTLGLAIERKEDAEAERDAALEREKALREALTFYADPGSYFAIAFIPDPPCGEFIEDFDLPDDPWENYGDVERPGKTARAALASHPDTP